MGPVLVYELPVSCIEVYNCGLIYIDRSVLRPRRCILVCWSYVAGTRGTFEMTFETVGVEFCRRGSERLEVCMDSILDASRVRRDGVVEGARRDILRGSRLIF